MGFSKVIYDRAAERAQYMCEMCGKNLMKKRKTDVAHGVVHSANGFHMIDGPQSYLITDPSPGFENLKGKRLHGKLFLVGQFGFTDDAFHLCPTCHRDIHSAALLETKINISGYKGRYSAPAILERVTLDMIAKGKT